MQVMPGTWPLREARKRLGEVVDRALAEGPQTISKRGRDCVVVISLKDLERLHGGKSSLVEFLARSPLKGLELDLAREKDTGRTSSRRGAGGR
jgi:prevent-host-death family protein